MNKIKMKKFLFFDYWALEYVKGFQRNVCKPVKYESNPVFVPNERDYEFNSCGYTTVMYQPDENLYKMWYGTSNIYNENIKAIKYLCLAVSKDGFEWERPELDVVDRTNIVMDEQENAMGSSVIFDSFDRKDPYKLVMRPKYTPAVVAYTSKDGVHWSKVNDKPVIEANSDCKVGLYQDPATGCYHALFRLKKGHRKTWMSESNDFLHWSKPVLVFEPDIADGPQVQIYGLQAAPYGNYVIGLSPMYNTVEQDMGWAKMEGTMDIELAFSRGGYCWKWVKPGSRFITLGNEGEWDGGVIHPTTAPIYLNDEIRFYYSGSSFTHENYERVKDEPQGIGLAVMRPDGFVSLECGNETGSLLTRPFAVINPDIYVNADCSKGYIKVEVCDGLTGKPLKGYSMDNCVPVEEDGIAQPVCWRNCEDREEITNRPIRFRIEGKNSKLYSIFIPNGNDKTRYWEFDEIGCVDPMNDIGNDHYYMKV